MWEMRKERKREMRKEERRRRGPRGVSKRKEKGKERQVGKGQGYKKQRRVRAKRESKEKCSHDGMPMRKTGVSYATSVRLRSDCVCVYPCLCVENVNSRLKLGEGENEERRVFFVETERRVSHRGDTDTGTEGIECLRCRNNVASTHTTANNKTHTHSLF